MEGIRGRSRSSNRSGRVTPIFSSMSLLWSPCFESLGMRLKIRPCVVSLLLALLQQGFPQSPMISPSLSPAPLNIEAVKKAVAEYERKAGDKVNFNKSEVLRLSAWTGSDTLPGPFCSSDEPVCILGVWLCLIWFAERLVYLGRSLSGNAVWRRKSIRTFPRLESDPKADGGRWPKHHLSTNAAWPFVTFLGPVTFHGLGKNSIGN